MNDALTEINLEALENVLASISDKQMTGFINQSINDFYAEFLECINYEERTSRENSKGKKLGITDFTLFGPGITIDRYFLSQFIPFNPNEKPENSVAIMNLKE